MPVLGTGGEAGRTRSGYGGVAQVFYVVFRVERTTLGIFQTEQKGNVMDKQTS